MTPLFYEPDNSLKLVLIFADTDGVICEHKQLVVSSMGLFQQFFSGNVKQEGTGYVALGYSSAGKDVTGSNSYADLGVDELE